MMEALRQKILRCGSASEKIALLDSLISAEERQEAVSFSLPPESECALKQFMAIGQWNRAKGEKPVESEAFRKWLQKLVEVDLFYQELGGIIGYHAMLLHFLQRTSEAPRSEAIFSSPSFVDITEENPQLVIAGLHALPLMAEMVPLGGAADRLHLVEESTGKELPAAKLCFAGRTLLEGLMRDLQAREYLYFKLFGTQLTTPVAMMTSEEKGNHQHVLQICSDHRWFGRPKESFRLFTQPLVPTVNGKGEWCFTEPLKLLLKPGGHGAIWKLARDGGIFAWLEKLGRKKGLIRQINNPVAGLDYGLLAFAGYGTKQEMLFGFASCPRRVGSAEGVNILIEKEGKVVLSNIEYCDFTKFGIKDLPLKEGEPYSRFSSNTNILFVDLKAVNRAVKRAPYPGLLCNLKEGKGRLEMTMQNIADVFVEKKEDPLRTFITYNHRHKTISTAKKAYLPGVSSQETPENCFYELLGAARELLQNHCAFQLPLRKELEEAIEKGPECAFLYHPALGPLYSIIAQKLRGGRLHLCSELKLEIADIEVKALDLSGSLLIQAEQVMGHWSQGILHYSSKTGRCVLRNVTIRNRGVDWENSKPYWKAQNRRFESVEIILKGHSELIIENVTIAGSRKIVVEDGMQLKIDPNGEEYIPLEEASPFWNYRQEGGISLERLGQQVPV